MQIFIVFDGETWNLNNFQREYFRQLLRSKIVININPDGWEGDYRLMEALACETLVISDKMVFPGSRAHPLVNNTHLLFFEIASCNQKQLGPGVHAV